MKPIFITGCPRSGTSIIANIIHLHGVYSGDVHKDPTPWNATGMYENPRIRNKVAKEYLRSIGADPLGQNPLPDRRQKIELDPDFKEKVLGILSSEGWDGERQWYLKEAKMALMWEQWAWAFPDAQWVLVRRNINDIVTSCMKTPFMSRRKKVTDWRAWVQYHYKRFAEMKSDLDVVEVWPDKLRKADFTEISKALIHLELKRPSSQQIVMDVFNGNHWHHTEKQQTQTPPATAD